MILSKESENILENILENDYDDEEDEKYLYDNSDVKKISRHDFFFKSQTHMSDEELNLYKRIFDENDDLNFENKKKTSIYMSKFEKTKIIGTRALQISMGSPVMIDLEPGETDPITITKKELKELRKKKIPMYVRRYFSDGTFEDRNINELIPENDD